MDRAQLKRAFDSAKPIDGIISINTEAWNIIAREVDKIITDLEKENMKLRADLEVLTDLATLPQPAVNIENMTVNYHAG